MFTYLIVILLAATGVSTSNFNYTLGQAWVAPAAPARCIAFSPNGETLVVCAGDRALVYENREGQAPALRVTLKGTEKAALSAAISPNGKLVAVTDEAGSLSISSLDTGDLVKQIPKAHGGKAIGSVGFTTDGKYVLTGGEDKTVRVWSAETGTGFAVLGDRSDQPKIQGKVVFVAGVPPHHAYSVDSGRQLMLWDVSNQRCLRASQLDNKLDVQCATADAGGLYAAFGLQTVQAYTYAITGGGSPIAPGLAKWKDWIRLESIEKGTQINTFGGETKDIRAVAVSPEGRFLASANSSNSVTVWDTQTGEFATNIPLQEPGTTVAFSPNGRWLAAGTKGGKLVLFQLTGVKGIKKPSTIIIVILEPANSTRTVGLQDIVVLDSQVTKRSLPIRGRVETESKLEMLEVNGDEITAVTPMPDRHAYEFTAYASLRSEGDQDVRITARNAAGESTEKTVRLQRAKSVEPPQVTQGRRIALIVGISEYQDASLRLKFAARDAQALYDLLTSPELGPSRFRPDDVQLLLDKEATVNNITAGLRQFLQTAREDDVVLFYFAGHGAPDPAKLEDLYLLAYDTNRNSIPAGIKMTHVREDIASVKARHVLILTDACHSAGISGPAGGRDQLPNTIYTAFLERLTHSSGGLAILTASEAAELSIEGEKWNNHGVFTDFLLEGLKGKADENSDGIIELGELMEYVRASVRKETAGRQNPGIGPTSFDREMPLVIVPH